MKTIKSPEFVLGEGLEQRAAMLLSFRYRQVNNIVVQFGCQRGETLIRQAFIALKKISGPTTEFPIQLEAHRQWMDECLVGTAKNLVEYAYHASSLAYRYIRKKKKRSSETKK